ncbi:MAG: alpha/beta hydrolase [Rhodospirillaceae bacterium]|nr:alpha/beta hydrolase [Rhodospirillaceae bacterium]
MSTFVDRFYPSPDGLRLHVRDYAGPADARFTVICIPGLTRNARDFETVAPHLAARYRVLCVSLRGRGPSDYAKDPMSYQPPTYVRDMMALFKHFGLKRAALVGTSLGGLVSILLGAVMPTKVLGIVLNDIGPDIDPAGLTRIAGFVARGYAGPSWDAAADALQALDGKLFPDYTRDDWLAMARKRFRQADDGTIHHNYDINIAKPFGDAAKAGAAATSLWPFYARLAGIPVLAVRGVMSDVLAPATFAKMKTVLPHIEQCTVPQRGHTPYLDEPVARAAVDDFLARLPGRLDGLTLARRTLRQIEFLIRLRLGGVPGA